MTGATILLGRNVLVFIEQMLRPGLPSINRLGRRNRQMIQRAPAAKKPATLGLTRPRAVAAVRLESTGSCQSGHSARIAHIRALNAQQTSAHINR
jgi:hypothetical protein